MRPAEADDWSLLPGLPLREFLLAVCRGVRLRATPLEYREAASLTALPALPNVPLPGAAADGYPVAGARPLPVLPAGSFFAPGTGRHSIAARLLTRTPPFDDGNGVSSDESTRRPSIVTITAPTGRPACRRAAEPGFTAMITAPRRTGTPELPRVCSLNVSTVMPS